VLQLKQACVIASLFYLKQACVIASLFYLKQACVIASLFDVTANASVCIKVCFSVTANALNFPPGV